MNAYTPGPWAIVGQDDHSDVDRAADCVMITGQADAQGLVEVALVYTTDSFDHWDCENERAEASEEYEANARLIAAAPDLYAACKKALGLVRAQRRSDLQGDVLDVLRDLRKAIAKAEARHG